MSTSITTTTITNIPPTNSTVDPNKGKIYTIGHASNTLDIFFSTLEGEPAIKGIVDVRSSPYSNRNSQFNRNTFEIECQDHGYDYIYLGQELGGKHEGGIEVLLETEIGKKGLQQLFRFSYLETEQPFRYAFMCAEANWRDCHRSVIATALFQLGVTVFHLNCHTPKTRELHIAHTFHTRDEIRLSAGLSPIHDSNLVLEKKPKFQEIKEKN